MTKLSCLPFGIGSLPHTDVKKACDVVLSIFPASPFWPELPRRDWRESMGIEQARGLPGFHLDEAAERVYFNASEDIAAGLGDLYEDFLALNVSDYAVSNEITPGFEGMLEAIEVAQAHPAILKGQLTGPTTLGLILKDQDKKALLYHEQMMDALVKATILKARWMASAMSTACDIPVIFFDEPMLQSIGSVAIPIDRAGALDRLREIVGSVDCVTGGHCCGNTDWSILMDAGLDIIAFDAWHFTHTLALYPEQLKRFIGRGGLVAWGIVPASAEGAELGVDALLEKLLNGLDHVAGACNIPAAQLASQSLITPSCGLGSLTEPQAEAILTKTAEIAKRLSLS